MSVLMICEAVMTIPLFCTFNAVAAGTGKDAPPDWEFSSRSLDAYANLMLGAGLWPTIFVAPECARAHAPMLEELRERGCELGLLVSPSQSSIFPKKKPMGTLTLAEQHLAITQARDVFTQFLYHMPKSIRTGFYSGNQETFELCQTLGFTRASITVPGAQLRQLGTVWPNDAPIRHAPIIDIPVTSNPDEKLFNRFPLYLSPEFGTTTSIAALVARGIHNGHVCVTGSTASEYGSPHGVIGANSDALLDSLIATESLRPYRLSDYTPTP
jgi:hypothetical protein